MSAPVPLQTQEEGPVRRGDFWGGKWRVAPIVHHHYVQRDLGGQALQAPPQALRVVVDRDEEGDLPLH